MSKAGGACAAGALVLLSACASVRTDPPGDAPSPPPSGPAWVGPLLALGAALPLAFVWDEALQEEATDHLTITGGRTRRGTLVALGLGAAAAGWAGGGLLAGDRGRRAQLLVEALALTGGATAGLKWSVRRRRPAGSSRRAFPSGHAALATAAAAVVAREAFARGGAGAWAGALLLGGAGYVAASRVEGNRHHTSDVVAGALLGYGIVHLLYGLHGAPGGIGLGIGLGF